MDNEPEMKNFYDGIKELITAFNTSIEAQMPALKQEVAGIIKTNCADERKIENTLDGLLSLAIHGFCNDLFIQLLEYYKTISAEGAAFYWNEYDEQNEE